MSPTAAPEIRLVSNIAVQFGYLTADQAAAAVANHVRRFWDPRMRSRLLEIVTAATEGLDPVVVAAVALLR